MHICLPFLGYRIFYGITINISNTTMEFMSLCSDFIHFMRIILQLRETLWEILISPAIDVITAIINFPSVLLCMEVVSRLKTQHASMLDETPKMRRDKYMISSMESARLLLVLLESSFFLSNFEANSPGAMKFLNNSYANQEI